jgi:hypothetical protein
MSGSDTACFDSLQSIWDLLSSHMATKVVSPKA